MIYVFLANGFEETEAIAPIDILKRSEKEVVTVGIGGDKITGAHGITVFADIVDSDVIMSEKVEMIVLPGGMPGGGKLLPLPPEHQGDLFPLDRRQTTGKGKQPQRRSPEQHEQKAQPNQPALFSLSSGFCGMVHEKSPFPLS